VKRSAELTPLSHDHHQALEVALRLRRVDAEEVETAVARFKTFWFAHGELHFEIEERRLLPALDQADPVWAEAVARVRAEHAEIRERAVEVLGGSPPDAGAARELGERLHEHVRFEERILFVLLEERLDAKALARLGRDLAADHAAEAPGPGGAEASGPEHRRARSLPER